MAAADTQWKPGQSGNPGGRPKGLSKMVREKLSEEEAVTLALTIARDPTHKQQLDALKMLFDRGWGKPAGFTLIEDDDPLGTTQEDLNAAVERFKAEVVRLSVVRDADPSAGGNGSTGEPHTG